MAAYDSSSSRRRRRLQHRIQSTANLPFLFSGANYTSQQVTDLAERYAAELSRLSTVLQPGNAMGSLALPANHKSVERQ